MVSNITSSTQADFPLQDTKAQAKEQVKKEQESFQKLIEQKAKAAQESLKSEEKATSPLEGAKEALKPDSTNIASKDVATEIPSTQTQSPQAHTPQTSMPQKSTEHSNAKLADEGTKTLADVKNLANQKDLKVGEVKLEGGLQNIEHKVVDSNLVQKTNTQDAQKSDGMGAQTLLAQKQAQSTLKSATTSDDPLAQALKEVTAKDLAARKMSKNEGIEYKKEKGGEKIAVIERGRTLPKNIAEANMRNAKRDEAYREVFEKFGVKEDAPDAQDLSLESKKKL